jgi:hypothetical protein
MNFTEQGTPEAYKLLTIHSQVACTAGENRLGKDIIEGSAGHCRLTSMRKKRLHNSCERLQGRC